LLAASRTPARIETVACRNKTATIFSWLSNSFSASVQKFYMAEVLVPIDRVPILRVREPFRQEIGEVGEKSQDSYLRRFHRRKKSAGHESVPL
jgi:hypothetical protein